MYEEGTKYTVLYFLDYGISFGGAVNTLLQQATLAKEAGHKIVIFFSDYYKMKMQDEYEEICDNLKIHYEWATYQITSQTEDIDVLCIDKNYEKLKKKILSYKPDILHSVQINPCVELVSRELKIPHIMNIYPLIPEFFSIDYIDIFPHYHICDSWFYVRKWKYYLKVDSTCIRTVANKTVHKTKETTPLNLLRFICVGSIYKEKNQLTVIKAFHIALKHGMQGKLTLCGYSEGKYGDECLRYIENNRLQDMIIIKGFCSDMEKEYLENDVLICGSTRESYPNVISEAMANGLVVISTPVAGVPEIIEDRKNGYLAHGYSEYDLYEKMLQLMEDTKNGKIKQLLKKTEEAYWKNHSPEAVTKQLIEYYKYVTNDYKKRDSTEENSELINIGYVRTIFKPLFEMFNKNIKYFKEPNKAAQKLWYLYHIKDIINANILEIKDFYIWGTGKYAVTVKEILDVFFPEINISGFLDSNKEGLFLGYNIYRPQIILQRKNIVVFIAAINGQDEMIEKLAENNKIYNKDFYILSARRW